MDPSSLLYPELGRIPFVGRQDNLREIDAIAQNPSGRPTIIFVTGDGGIGKTEVLKEVLQRCAEQKPYWHVAMDVVDVYHPGVRTKFGLAEQIVNVLSRDGTASFAGYAEERSTYRRQLLSASGAGIGKKVEDMRKRFTEGLEQLCARSTVLFALDTAEKLVYPPVKPGGEALADDLWDWLCDLLNGLNNIVVLVAGRPPIRALQTLAANYPALQLHSLELLPFSLDEYRVYLNELSGHLRRHDRLENADRLTRLPPQMVEHVHSQTGGDPISLALIADLIAVGGDLPDELFEDSATSFTDDSLRSRREDLQRSWLSRLLERPMLGQTLNALGYLPRGATSGLLARVLGTNAADALTLEEVRDRLSAVAYLSIVKVPRNDQRIFLHDEIYVMLRRWFQDNSSMASLNQQVHHAVREYYDETIQEVQRHLNELSLRLEQETPPSPEDIDQLVDANDRRRQLLVDALYYRLRQDASLGFERYYRYMREAILTGDIVQDRELQTTMMEFLAESGDGPVQTLIRDVLTPRRLVRLWAEGRYESVAQSAESHRQARRWAYAVNDAVVDSWDAYARIYLGGEANLAFAKNLLDAAVTFLRKVLPQEAYTQDQPEAATWRTLAVLAFTLRVRGYWLWSRGLLRASLPDYQEAARVFRRLNFQVELATTLNDLGFTLAELGSIDDGRALVRQALELRESLASRPGTAIGMNTLALIDVIEGKFEAAVPLATRARNIFRALEISRGEGLSELTLAEAWRRRSNPETTPDAARRVEELELALAQAGKALAIFNDTGEQLRRAQAWIEIGCGYRDLVLAFGSLPDNKARIAAAQQSEDALRTAAAIAETVGLRWQIDAWVNLARLGDYADQPELLAEAERKTRQLINTNRLDVYYVNELSGKPNIEEAQAESWVWAQIGKLHVVLADQLFAQYLKSRPLGLDPNIQSDDLEKSIRHYAIGLENNQYHRDDNSRDMRRVKTQVENKLRSLTNKELSQVSELLLEFEAEFHLRDQGSFMRNFLERRALL